MKKILVAFIVSFSLISCSISEQIIFNSDGSGKLAYTIDMSKMIALTKDMDKSNKMTKDITESTEKDMDSVIVFKEAAAKFQKEGKEMTPAELANFEQMKNYSMRMIVNKERSEMKYILFTDFKNISEVGNIGSALSSMKNLSGKKSSALDAANPKGDSEVSFLFDGKSFSRTVVEKPYVEEIDTLQWEDDSEYDEESDSIAVVADTAAAVAFDYEEEVSDSIAVDDSEEIISDEDVDNSEIEDIDVKKMEKEFKKLGKMMKKGLEDSFYEFQYTFAKKVKKVSLPKSSYKLSDDKKSIFIKYKFDDFSKKIKDLNFNIEFE